MYFRRNNGLWWSVTIHLVIHTKHQRTTHPRRKEAIWLVGRLVSGVCPGRFEGWLAGWLAGGHLEWAKEGHSLPHSYVTVGFCVLALLLRVRAGWLGGFWASDKP